MDRAAEFPASVENDPKLPRNGIAYLQLTKRPHVAVRGCRSGIAMVWVAAVANK